MFGRFEKSVNYSKTTELKYIQTRGNPKFFLFNTFFYFTEIVVIPKQTALRRIFIFPNKWQSQCLYVFIIIYLK